MLNQSQFKQGTLFRTDKHGPANVYYKHEGDHFDPDRDLSDTTSDVEVHGEFFEFNQPAGTPGAIHELGRGSHGAALREDYDWGTGEYSSPADRGVVGHENFPKGPNTDLKYEDLEWEETENRSRWGKTSRIHDIFTPAQEHVGRVESDETDTGTLVKYAEINRQYQGRGWSRQAIPDYLHRFANGPIYVDGYTQAGEQAFGKVGIKRDSELEEQTITYDEEGYEVYDPDKLAEVREREHATQLAKFKPTESRKRAFQWGGSGQLSLGI